MLCLYACHSLSTPPTRLPSLLHSRLGGNGACASQSVSSGDVLSQLKAFSTSSIIRLHPFGDIILSTAFYKYPSSQIAEPQQHYEWTGNSDGQRQCCTQCSGHSSTNVSPFKSFLQHQKSSVGGQPNGKVEDRGWQLGPKSYRCTGGAG